ncbi:MAG TPA: TIR domain-containing protein [Caulobacteraceae bacterium]|nr:TIR domain-containing protein [Caulobacteraceae bacterium]
MADVFLSYAREDVVAAQRFAEALEGEQFSVWWDRTLRSGEAYDEAIETALRGAKAVVVLWSPSSVRSRWVRSEATIADRENKLIPAMIASCERPVAFELTHTADLCGWSGDVGQAAWRDFAADIRRMVEGAGPCAEARAAEGTKGAVDGQAGAEAPANSICVLPFANRSGDAEEDDFFADGLTEDIITDLSRFHHLFVISRNSAFQYKGKAVAARQVAREFNVRYVLEGSVRKVGRRVRVTVQLVDGQAGCHVWAERYDRELQDIFALQDEVTAAIVATLPGRVEAAAGERVGRKPTENMTAYECVLAGKRLHHRATAADNERALALLDRAIALDPQYAHAHAWKACALGQAYLNGWIAERDRVMRETIAELDTALKLDSNDSDTHRILAAVTLIRGDHDKAMHHQRRALELNPNDDLVVVQQGEMLTWVGQAEEGARWIEKAMRLNPGHPERFWSHLGRALFVAGRWTEAASAFARISAPGALALSYLAGCAAELGQEAKARSYAAQVLEADPGFSVDACVGSLHYQRSQDRDRHRAALLKAGLPEVTSAAG